MILQYKVVSFEWLFKKSPIDKRRIEALSLFSGYSRIKGIRSVIQNYVVLILSL